jgi:hypothetical protein
MIGITLPPGVQEETTCAKYLQMDSNGYVEENDHYP